MSTTHLDPLRKQIQESQIVPPPSPWQLVSTLLVGGLRAVGFDRQSELLLIVSNSGRAIINCESGKKVARDHSDYFQGENVLEAEGIGLLQGTTFRMAGLFGGGLPVITQDHWSVEIVTLHFPIKEILLLEPMSDLYGFLYDKPNTFYKIASETELRACGFSYSGRSLIVATSSEVTVFRRI